MASQSVSDAVFERQFRAARARGAHSIRTKPHAKSVRYDGPTRMVTVELMNGASFSLPVDIIPGLQGASDADLADVWVATADPGVHWETLDVDYEIYALVKTILDTGTLIRALKPGSIEAIKRLKTLSMAAAARAENTAVAPKARKRSTSKRPVANRTVAKRSTAKGD
jgi:Protein of unknown function (DUF2442)